MSTTATEGDTYIIDGVLHRVVKVDGNVAYLARNPLTSDGWWDIAVLSEILERDYEWVI